MGADIVDLTLPRSFRDYGSASGRIMAAEAYALLSHIVDNNELPIDEAVRPRIRAGAAISSREYLEVLAERERLKLEFAAATAHVDALLAPVTMTPAIPLATVDQSTTPAVLHALGQLPRSVWAGRAQRVHPVRIAAVAADRLPRRRRGDGVAHRLGLAERDRLARACPTAGAVGERQELGHEGWR